MKLQNYKEEIDDTVLAIQKAMTALKEDKHTSFPSFPSQIIKRKAAYALGNSFVEVPLEKAIGKIIAENIIPYPPGIPLIAKGEEFQQAHLEYLLALKRSHGLITVMMTDMHINTVKIVSTNGTR